MQDTQAEKRKNTDRRPLIFIIVGFLLIVIGATIAVVYMSNRSSEQARADCITQSGYQMAVYDGHDVLISDAQTGELQKPTLNLSRLKIGDMVWSPDGRMILLYASEAGSSGEDVYVFSPDGGRLRNLSNGEFPLESSKSVAWSPDGKIISLLWRDSATPAMLHYELIDPASGDMIWSADSEDMFSTSYGHLWQWSPDGHKLALILNQDGFYNLHVYNLLDKTLTPIAQPVSKVPDWSPDSTQLLLTEPQFQIVDAASGNTILSFQDAVSGQVTDAEWSPDGSQIIYQKAGTYFVMNADGGNTVSLSSDAKAQLLSTHEPVASLCVEGFALKAQNPIPVTAMPPTS